MTTHSTWSWSVLLYLFWFMILSWDQMQSQSLILREKVSKNRIPGSPKRKREGKEYDRRFVLKKAIADIIWWPANSKCASAGATKKKG
jgi:hypothetical protein